MSRKILLIIRIVIAIILIQTLRYKFTAHTDSVYIFSQINLEPYGRIGIGILELIAAVLILIPRTIWIGALLTFGIISGAILLHLTHIGIEVNNDDGKLFYIAIALFLLSLIILYYERKNISFDRHKL